MKSRLHWVKQLILTAVFVLLAAGFLPGVAKAQAGVTVVADRGEGSALYTISGFAASAREVVLTVALPDTDEAVLEKTIILTEAEAAAGSYTGSFTLEELSSYQYTEYQVKASIAGVTIGTAACDFSVHKEKAKLSADSGSEKASRTFMFRPSVEDGDVLAPGKGNQVSLLLWKKGSKESAAKKAGTKSLAADGKEMSFKVNLGKTISGYGKWNGKLVLSNDAFKEKISLAQTTFEVEPSVKTISGKKTKDLEKKAAFAVQLKGLKNPYTVKKVAFQVSNSKGREVYRIKASKKSESAYEAVVRMKALDYKLGSYTVKAFLTDSKGVEKALDVSCTVDQSADAGKWTVTKKQDATAKVKITGAYLPGNIKKVAFVLKQDGKKLSSYEEKGTKRSYSARFEHSGTGAYEVSVYGYSKWGKKILLGQKTYTMKKKDMGKNGWVYENYAGQKYRFYYINNVKQTDLTDILNIKKGGSGSRFLIEINRAACVVNVYLYNEETGKYDTPVKTFTVSVGRDVYTNAGAGSLNIHSSFTPLGSFSICSNGQAVRYPLKPMHEPDGSVVYARWCSHIVGNVYFHAVAVGSQSHYALSSYSYNRLGSPASAGCVRMTVADAKWLYDYAATGTKIKIVSGSSAKPGPLGKAPTIKISGVNYDPTDPEVPDSRKKLDYKAKRISGYMTKSGKKVGY